MDNRKLTSRKGSEPHCQAQISQEDGNGTTIAITYDDTDGANAAEIVRRWNNFPALVEALKAINDGLDACETNEELCQTVGMAMVQARSALAAVTTPQD